MTSPTAAADFSTQLDRLITAALLSARQAWTLVPAGNITGGWAAIGMQLVAQVAAAQIRAARMGDEYVPQVLDELGISAESVATVVPQALAIGTESGVDLATLLGSVPARALHAASAAGPDAGLDAGLGLLEGIVQTSVADAGRLGASLRTAASPRVGGYVREVSTGACGRCLVLAGKWYRWSSGFLRHPRCQCVNVPVGQAQGRDMVTDADAAFRSMNRAQQEKAFTVGGAKAIRDGADISQVVNARLGISVAGHTTVGTTRQGIAGARLQGRARLLPEQLYKQATSREDALRLLRAHGYLL